jgi:flavin-dependent dehydrogenase
MTDHDIVCVGGGLAGSALAIAMAKKGARVTPR